MNPYRDWHSLREVDVAWGRPKGSAFRAFRLREAALSEGEDYLVLHHQQDRQAINVLKQQGRLYLSSVNVILLSKQGLAKLAGTAPLPKAIAQ